MEFITGEWGENEAMYGFPPSHRAFQQAVF